MSFRILARGSKKFHFSRNNVPDGKEFDAMKLYNMLAFLDHSPAGVIDAGLGHISPGITDLLSAQGKMVYVRQLKTAVDALAIDSSPGEGYIKVFARENHLFWADDTSYTVYRFAPGDNPGSEFIKKTAPGLEETDMTYFTVLEMMAMALSMYKSRLVESKKGSKVPKIIIQLTK